MTDATIHAPFGTHTPVRKRLTPHDAQRRTLRVKVTRFAFIGAAVAAILALVGNVAVRLVQTANQPGPAVVQGENLVIENPRFVGAAKDGSKIIVTAEKATRSMTAQDGVVQLEKPVLETSDGSQATANTGIWSQDKQNLLLDGDVVLTRQGGDRATSSSAVWTSIPSQLTMNGGVTLTRLGGDRATSDTAIWSKDTSQLSVIGNVQVSRTGGATATSGVATWRSDIGALDLTGGANINLPSGESASALTARLDDRRGDVMLYGQAVVRFSAGQASSSRAIYSSSSGQLKGEGGVQITSGLGTGTADSYTYETRSKRLNMSGNARVILR
jgi:lipopolysaccharide export system protein LptC